jgi:hypothetical protein
MNSELGLRDIQAIIRSFDFIAAFSNKATPTSPMRLGLGSRKCDRFQSDSENEPAELCKKFHNRDMTLFCFILISDISIEDEE